MINFKLTNPISFPAKIARQGNNARIITVPKEYWENGIIEEDKIYQVYLIEIGVRLTKTLKNKVREKHNNKCTICGNEKDNLQIHHKDGNFKNNDLQNLILLCKNCHVKKQTA